MFFAEKNVLKNGAKLIKEVEWRKTEGEQRSID